MKAFNRLSAVTLAIVTLTLMSCDRTPPVNKANEKIILKAYSDYKAFSAKVIEDKDASIDLTYLDKVFPRMEICHFYYYGLPDKFLDNKNVYESYGEKIAEQENEIMIFSDKKTAYLIYRYTKKKYSYESEYKNIHFPEVENIYENREIYLHCHYLKDFKLKYVPYEKRDKKDFHNPKYTGQIASYRRITKI